MHFTNSSSATLPSLPFIAGPSEMSLCFGKGEACIYFGRKLCSIHSILIYDHSMIKGNMHYMYFISYFTTLNMEAYVGVLI